MAGAHDSQRDLLEDLRAVLRRVHANEDSALGGELFGRAGDAIVLIQPARLTAAHTAREIEVSVWAEVALGRVVAPGIDGAPEDARALDELSLLLREKNFLSGEQRVARGGVAVALALGCLTDGHGFDVELTENDGDDAVHALFGERGGRAVVTCRASAHLALTNFVDRSAHFTAETIGRITESSVRVRWMGEIAIRDTVHALAESLTV